jgi:hypothetical protein
MNTAIALMSLGFVFVMAIPVVGPVLMHMM